ncbi:uncharacterized protein V6R79_001959 [Siganus canaliculatus]
MCFCCVTSDLLATSCKIVVFSSGRCEERVCSGPRLFLHSTVHSADLTRVNLWVGRYSRTTMKSKHQETFNASANTECIAWLVYKGPVAVTSICRGLSYICTGLHQSEDPRTLHRQLCIQQITMQNSISRSDASGLALPIDQRSQVSFKSTSMRSISGVMRTRSRWADEYGKTDECSPSIRNLFDQLISSITWDGYGSGQSQNQYMPAGSD